MEALIPPTIIRSIQTTFGAALIGTWIDIGIYGFVTCQVYIYFTTYTMDMVWTKAMVLFLWILSTFHAVVTCHISYYYLISNIFNPVAFEQVVWSLVASVAVHVIIVATVLIHFTFAVYKIAGKRARIWITSVLSIAVCAHFGFGIFVVSKLSDAPSIQSMSSFTRTGVMPMGISQVVADVVIAASLCILLNDKRDRINKRTSHLLKTLMVYALNRCILTSVVAAVDFLAVAIDANAFWVIGCEFVINDLYVCSVLASLNARSSLRETAGVVSLAGDLTSHQLSDSYGSSSRRTVGLPSPQNKFYPGNLLSDNTVVSFVDKV